MKKCPYCAEEIQDEAKLCKHCGKEIKAWYNQKIGCGSGFFLLIIGVIIIVCISNISTPPSMPTQKIPPKIKQELAVQRAEQQKAFKTSKANFQKYALENLAITWFQYQSDWQIWVKLTLDKYTTEENVEMIALHIARSYRMQTGYKRPIVVTVWHPFKKDWVAKGQLP